MKWFLLLLSILAFPAKAEALKVGSKRFTESYILGEILVRAAGEAVHRPGLGNTGIVYSALKSGSIDVYPEYTGTIAKEILKLEGHPSLVDLNRALAKQGIGVGVPLGFQNGYALAMREDRARALGIRTLSDLGKHADLKLGLSQEFIGRADGWPGLKAAYRLPFATPQGLDHGLAYEAIAAGRIDVMDIYTTDAKIGRYKLLALEDDRKYFPRYDAVLLYRLDLPKRFAEAWAKLQKLEGRIDEKQMIRLNAAAELDKRSFAEAAALFFNGKSGTDAGRTFLGTLFGADFWRLTGQHLLLVFASLAASIAAGIPLGVLAQKVRALRQVILGVVGVIQTIPSLALFAFLIALMGTIGTVPALVALFLYALLPIVSNTCTGLDAISLGMRQAALALGLHPAERLKLVELPLALPSILAGIKTSAVINVGTATIAAFVGAGGYGERIVSGLALNDNVVLLAGAVPAAALALLVQGAFELGERRFGWMARARTSA
ncbi:MAG TPA: glycine betaine ABC transporter substrate-binding protein [Burkholderiales bacterium]|jgi:osmoprotectant transport system permease protein|nr:glycine betaine ABC transporter substrate-binding protein [Burkholderiales bacterium]